MVREANAGRLAIIVPARNERLYISSVVSECRSVSPNIFVVDDGSVDGTGRIARRAGATVLTTERGNGLGQALMHGFQYLRRDFDTIVTLDGDGAHDPTHIPKMVIQHINSRADLTIGSRFLCSTLARQIPSAKVAANHVATYIMNAILDTRLTDAASGMRVLGPRALELSLATRSYGIAYELLARAVANRLRITEFPIGVRYDARELFCTTQREMLDFLHATRALARRHPVLQRRLEWLTAVVSRFQCAHLKVGDRHVVMQPIPGRRAFIFQFQAPWFIRNETGAGRRRWRDLSSGGSH